MNRWPLWLRTCILVIMFALFISGWNEQVSLAQQPLTYRYAYGTHNESDEFFLNLVDPANPGTSFDAILMPANDGYRIRSAKASPNGEWVFARMRSTESSATTLRLFSPQSREVRDVMPVSAFWDILWSPDGRRIAFTVADTPEQTPVAYIYDIETDRVRYIVGEPSKGVYDVSWSPDSLRLLTASNVCDRSNSCHTALEIFDVSSLTSTAKTDFISFGDRTCDFAWSPDNREIAFLFSCGFGIGSGLSEVVYDVFVWHISVNAVERVTHFTQDYSDGSVDFSNQYGFEHGFTWYDPATLLIGTVGGSYFSGVGYVDSSFVQHTSVYRTNNTQSVVSPQVRVDWLLNPAYPREIAYRNETYTLYTDPINGMRLNEPSLARIEIATFDGAQFSPFYTGIGGCDLDWSPDGEYLVYSNPVTPLVYCGSPIMSLEFVSRATRSAATLPISYPYISLVGWVAYGEPPTPTAIPTNTEPPAST